MKHSISELFRAWGAAQRKLPAAHETLRTQVLDTARPRARSIEQSPRGIRWPALAFAALAAIAFLTQPEQFVATPRATSIRTDTSDTVTSSPQTNQFANDAVGYGAPAALNSERSSTYGLSAPSQSIAPWYPVPPQPESPPITDRRELLEWSYRATIRTGRIEEIGARSQTMVRGYGGRIDRVTLNDRFGNIEFAVPVNRFDAFRAELATLARARFLFTENVSAENRLSEQRGIEESLRSNEDALKTQKNDRAATADRYRAQIAAQNKAIAQKTTERNAARATLSALPPDAPDRVAATARLQALDRDLGSLQRELRRLTGERDNRLAAIDGMIRNFTDAVAQLQTQEATLHAEVATVHGTVMLYPIAYGSLVGTFLRNHWIALALFASAALALVRFRARRIELPTS